MKKLIEFFKWDYEGEYQQYFYVVEDEKKFVKKALIYLNSVTINSDFPWSDCLELFKIDNKVEGYFLFPTAISHLNEYYYIKDDKRFTLEKITYQQKRKVIR